MGIDLFDTFSKMLDYLPPRALCGVIERELRMIEDDRFANRVANTRDVQSVFTFCQMITSIKDEEPLLEPAKLPAAHLSYYRTVVDRLIKAGELPSNAREIFDAVAGPHFWDELMS